MQRPSIEPHDAIYDIIMIMSYPEGQYDVVKPRSWADLVRDVADARQGNPEGTRLTGIEFGPTGEDELARRRTLMGGSAYAAAATNFVVLWQQHPPREYILAENEDGIVRFEPSNHEDHSQPAKAHYVPVERADTA